MKKRDICIIGLLCLWFAFSMVALAGMYHLWWTRERVLYIGKPVYAQQKAIFNRAGLPPETLDLAQKVDMAWPKDVAYKATCSEVDLSYVKYLLLPRIPSGSTEYRLDENKHGYSFSPDDQGTRTGLLFSTLAPTPKGFIISAAILLMAAVGLRRFGLSVPEGGACAAFFLGILIVISKGVFHSIDAAGWIMVLLAPVSAFVVLCRGNLLPTNRNVESNRVILLASILVLLGAIVWSFLMSVVVGPDDWDAWAQWGPKAKILALSGGSLSDVRYFVTGSGDYPLMWPSLWAFSGWCAGGWEEQWSKALGPLFLLLTAWQMGTLSSRFTGRRELGFVTAALFVSMPAVPLVASWAYAEAPLWLFLVSATGRMLLWQQSGRRADLLLAGLLAAGAACTKNEGVLFVALSSLWVIFINSHRIRDFFLFLLPSMLSYGFWKAFALLSMKISNRAVKALGSMDWIGNQWFDVLSAAGNHVLSIWADVRQWNIVLLVLLLMAGWLLFRGLRQDRLNLLLPLTFMTGLFAVVLSHGNDWSWQLGVSWNRLTIQGLAVLIPVLICGMSRRWMQVDRAAS